MPQSLLSIIVCALAAYLIGAIPFGYLIARLKGVNLFEVGSGNIGATNVGRVLGKRYGVLVFLLDFAKGAVPILVLPGVIAKLFPDEAASVPRAGFEVTAAVGAFLGHLFPVYLGFRGGKGVATGCGTIFVLVPGPASITVLFWLTTVAASRIVSLASIVGAFALVAARLVGTPHPFDGEAAIKTWFCIGAAALVVVKHRDNLRRLRAGNENQLRDSPMWQYLGRSAHVVSLGIWVGAAVFFNFIAAPAIFISFQDVVHNAPSDRTAFLPLAPDAPDKRRDQLASALAGAAVGPLFPRFFALEAICGALALITALGWRRAPGRVHRWRVIIIAAALLTVAAGWPLSNWVSELRVERYSPGGLIDDKLQAQFANAHLLSLGLSFVTAILGFVALVMAARMPAVEVKQE